MALPKAMERIEKNLESVARMGRMKGSSEAQLAGLLAVCEEQQRLLKLAFIGKTPMYDTVYSNVDNIQRMVCWLARWRY